MVLYVSRLFSLICFVFFVIFFVNPASFYLSLVNHLFSVSFNLLYLFYIHVPLLFFVLIFIALFFFVCMRVCVSNSCVLSDFGVNFSII